jgi:exoribonuclease II
LRQKQLDLAQPSQELKALEEYFQVVKTGENTLASYDAQLDEHVEQARHLKSELEEIRQVLPWLHGFSRQRKQWQAAKQNQESLILELAKLEAEFQPQKI